MITALRNELKNVFTEYEVEDGVTRNILILIEVIEHMMTKIEHDLQAQIRFMTNLKACINDRDVQAGEMELYFDKYMDKIVKEMEE